MVFSSPVVGCLVKEGLQKGGLRAPQDPPGYALGIINNFIVNFDLQDVGRLAAVTGC